MTDAFIHWNIGHVDRWPIRIDGRDLHLPRREYRRWVLVHGERFLYAHLEGEDRLLLFERPEMLNDCRRKLQGSRSPRLHRVSLSWDDDEAQWCGELELLTFARPFVLEKPLPVVTGPLLQEALAKEPRGAKSALDALWVRCLADVLTPGGWGKGLFAKIPLLAEGASTAPGIELLMAGGGRLHAHVEGVTGDQRLVLDRVSEDKKSFEERGASLVLLGSGASHSAEQSGIDLSCLQPIPNPLLAAWLEYSRVEKERDDRLFQARLAAPLEFNAISDLHGRSFKLAIVTESLAKPWGKKDGDVERGSKLDAPVRIHDVRRPDWFVDATLERFRHEKGRLMALVRMSKAEERPPTEGGRILVREADEGTLTSRKRQGKAVDRLRTGAFANPRLLELLAQPAQAREAVAEGNDRLSRETLFCESPEDRQLEAIRKAVRLPELLLVQGPPGTGKSQVICRVVEELVRRGRKDGDDPLRILISGPQNDALASLHDSLAGVAEVHLDVSASEVDLKARVDEQRLARSGRWVDQLRHRYEGTVVFREAEALERLDRELPTLLDRVVRADHAALGTLVDELLALRLEPLGPERLEAVRSLVSTWRSDMAAAEAPVEEAEGDAGEPLASLRAEVARLDAMTPEVFESRSPVELRQARDSLSIAVDGIDDPRTCVDDVGRAEAWMSLLKAMEGLRMEGRSLSAAEHLTERLRKHRASTAPPREVSAAVASALGVDARARLLHAFRGRLLAWCDTAVHFVRGRLELLRSSKEYAILEWARSLTEPGKLGQVLQRHAVVSAATCNRSEKLRRQDDPFDVVIIDEAARSGIDVLIPLTSARTAILVGDHRQLPPHCDDDLLALMNPEVVEQVRGIDAGSWKLPSLFDWLLSRGLPKSNFIMLDKQFRMHERIGELVSRAFYERGLKHHYAGERALERTVRLGPLPDEQVVFIDIGDNKDQRNCSTRNEWELDAITRMVTSWDLGKLLDLQRSLGDAKRAVGMLFFYNDQLDDFRMWMRSQSASLQSCLWSGTVHASQGREFPVVVVATTRSMKPGSGSVGFLEESESANVALSRAQRKLVVFGDRSLLQASDQRGGSAPWRRVIELLQKTPGPGQPPLGRIIPSGEVT